MSDQASTAYSQVPWQKLLIWGIFLAVVYYLRELFLIVFITFLMSYIIRNIVAALKNRIALGQNRPWLDRGLTLATFAGLLICVGAVSVFLGPRFLQQSRLLLVQAEGIRPQDTLNSLMDRTVGVYLLRKTYGKPGDERYDTSFQAYQQQGRYGEGLYHDFPTLKLNLESDFELAYEQTEKQRAHDELAGAGATSAQFDEWFLNVKAPDLFAKQRDSYLARWSAQYATPEKVTELAQLKKQDDFDQVRNEQIRDRILKDVKADPVTKAELEKEWQESVVTQHWLQFKKSAKYQSRFKTYYESRRSASPTAVPVPYDVYALLCEAYPQGKAQFAKVLQAHTKQTTESSRQMQEDFERATRRELTRKWWTTDPAAASLREHVRQDVPQVAESVAFHIEEAIRSFIALPAQLATALLLTIFITLDFNELKQGCLNLRESRIRDIFDEIATGLVILARLIGKSFSAQGVIALFNTLFTFVLLWLLGIQNELLFCAIVFVASFIPVVGVFLSGIPITIQAILQPGGSIGLAALVIAGIILVHLIEASVLSPKIVGKVLHLHPVMVLAILAIGEHLFGIWGLLLGVPVAVYIMRVVVLNEPIPGIYEPADTTIARQQ